jgi:hypothetical protein
MIGIGMPNSQSSADRMGASRRDAAERAAVRGVRRWVMFGSQPVSLSAGVRHYADKPQGGPDWGLRLQLTLLFPA